VHARAAPVVRLEGPLALGHGCLSSLRMASATPPMKCLSVRTRPPLVSSSVSLASRRGLRASPGAAVSPLSGDCSRVLTRFRWVKPVQAAAQTVTIAPSVTDRRKVKICLQSMLQNGWHPLRKLLASANAASITKRRRTTKRGRPRVVSPQDLEPVSRFGTRPPAGRQQNDDGYPISTTCG
jgi:hypothetical protein